MSVSATHCKHMRASISRLSLPSIKLKTYITRRFNLAYTLDCLFIKFASKFFVVKLMDDESIESKCKHWTES